MFLPIYSGPTAAVSSWLAGLDDAEPDALQTQLSQSALLKWKRRNVGHRCFTVVRHPVVRAHAAFVEKILIVGEDHDANARGILERNYELAIPAQFPDVNYSPSDHRAAFKEFLKFVKANLTGQTGVGVNAHWATQHRTLQGFAEFALPDVVMREDRLEDDLAVIAAQIGKSTMPQVDDVTDPHAALLADIYDDEIEALTKAAYRRDYETFGFDSYEP